MDAIGEVFSWNSKPYSLDSVVNRCRIVWDWEIDRSGVFGVISSDRLKYERGIVYRLGKGSDLVER